ncbi:MAG: glycosyltransferase family 2 protein [Faecousia sp.]
MNEPKISVIIPVYNVENYLRRCLDSVISQTYQNLDIILIDDGSKDSSGAICDEYATKDSRIRCFHQINAGVSNARNVGISVASGDYFHFLDSDDYIETDTYEYLIQKMQETGSEAIGFEYFVTYPGKEIAHYRTEKHCGLCNTKDAVREHLFGGNNFLCSKLLPARVVKPLRFHEDIFRDEDTLFGFEAIRNIKTMYYTSRPLLHYVQSVESACRGKFRPNQLSAVKVIPIMETALKADFPELLIPWRVTYLHLMIMLYSDMYLDEEDYKQEQCEIYETFKSILKRVHLCNVSSVKNKVKFMVFRLSPQLFCRLHKYIHKF